MDIIIDKPFKNYSEQIQLIKQKNIEIEDPQFAEKALSNFSYYTLINGYKNSVLYDKVNRKFIDHTTFEMLCDIRRLDSSLNNILFKYILVIEKSLKSKLGYRIASQYGEVCDFYYHKNAESDYLYDEHYSTTSKGYNRTNILNQLRDILSSRIPKKSSSNYYKVHKGYVPPWIFSNDIPFGMVIKWYQILQKDDKTEVAEKLVRFSFLTIEEKKNLLTSSLDLLREFRNAIAHGNKTFAYLPRTKLPTWIISKIVPRKVLSKKEMQKDIGRNDLYAICLLIILLIDDNKIINDFLAELRMTLTKFTDLHFPDSYTIYDVFKIPENIIERLQLLIKSRGLGESSKSLEN